MYYNRDNLIPDVLDCYCTAGKTKFPYQLYLAAFLGIWFFDFLGFLFLEIPGSRRFRVLYLGRFPLFRASVYGLALFRRGICRF